jgi:hypothetical protein
MSNNQNNQSMSNNQNQITMNNNTTTPQEFQYTLEQAIEIVKHNASSIWRTEDVLNLMNRIKAKEVYVEVSTEQSDMEESIEFQEHINSMLELIEDIDTSMEAVESSIDNIEVDVCNIELSLQGNEIHFHNVDIDGRVEALTDLDSLRIEIRSLKSKIQELAGKEVAK